MTLKIEKGVPVSKKGKPGRKRKYDFAKMKVGDSFLSETYAASNAAYVWGAAHGRKFTTRRIADGWRTWRIE